MIRGLGPALAYAHGRRLYHRDVEPGNVLFDAEGRALLADFDLAIEHGKLLETGLSHAAPAV